MPAHVESYVGGVVALFGLIWGSYLNVVVYRLPRGLSTAVPASHCPRCLSRIRPLQNVPVLSWLLLGARCSNCRGVISPRYPLVEMVVAAIFVLGFHRFDQPLAIFASWVLGWSLLALALIDFDRRVVPLVLTLPLGLGAWIVQPILGWTRPWNAVATSLLAAAVVVGLAAGWTRLRGRDGVMPDGPGLGLGDAYALFLVGAFFGLEPTLQIIVWATLAASAILVASWLGSRAPRRTGRRRKEGVKRLPLVTFLALAALWVLLLSPRGPTAAGTAAAANTEAAEAGVKIGDVGIMSGP